MQPRRILERHIIYKPLREPEEPGASLGRRGGTQQVAQKQKQQAAPVVLYYTKLIQKLHEADFDTPQDGGKSLSAEIEEGEEPVWSQVFSDVPDTGDRGVSIRFTNTSDLLSGDPHAHMIASGPNQSDCLEIHQPVQPLTSLQIRH
jgi:mediator of RNA polymerase II transcription subunit 18